MNVMTKLNPNSINVLPELIDSPVGVALTSALDTELNEIYPEEESRYPDIAGNEVMEPLGGFLVAYLGEDHIGCGAIRRIGDLDAEIKRIYVKKPFRGMGVGRILLDSLEAESRHLGVSRLVLETGNRLPHALALYRKAGFIEIPRFGNYLNSPLSICMEKILR